MKHSLIPLLFLFLTNLFCSAQDGRTAWDNTINKNWPVGFTQIEIESSMDGSNQKAWFHKSSQSGPQPLIISLHTWSGDYSQEDPLAKEILLRDWNYIHPDFRGPNNNPKACGSPLVIADLEDAIHFAVQNGNVDTNNVHIIGASGGGYVAMLAYMKIDYPVKSFNAWVGISNLADWYWESKGRNAKYADDIEKVAIQDGKMNWEELDLRSPDKLPFPAIKRKKATLNIYTGIHDGYTGSVPITHSINMYNKLLADMYPDQKNKSVSDSLKLELVTKRLNSNPGIPHFLGGRQIHLIRVLPHLSLTIFEGGHEMIVPQALSLIPVNGRMNTKKLNILTIGDSNAAAEVGWPNQLRKLLPYSTVINKSVSGNTIGFDNLDQEKLNTLKNIDRYLEEAFPELGSNELFDIVLIGLGTNDTKKVFESRQKEVPKNMEILIQKIRQWADSHQKRVPDIYLISPPPIDEQKANTEKYGGGDGRIQKNNLQFRKIAKANHADFLDVYTPLKPGITEKTSDGVHLTEAAQFQLAKEIENYLNTK